MRQNLAGIVSNLRTMSVSTQGYITLMSDFTMPLAGKKICNKIMDRFSVFISYPV
jgi:hypothetical protein